MVLLKEFEFHGPNFIRSKKLISTDLITQTFENQMNEPVRSIHKFDGASNNAVYKIETASNSYIFKIYVKRDWPEDGKLPFVVKKLSEYNVPHAKLFIFCREDDNFPGGYLIEECLPGTTTDRLSLSCDETAKLFERLAETVSRVHRIKLAGFGYIGSGEADYDTFSEHMYDVLTDNVPRLVETGALREVEAESVCAGLYEKLKPCDKFPSVLNHGDLSIKNVMVNSNGITLIDWDDAHSLCWAADLARLTLWMKINYGANEAALYRKVFMESYETEHDKNFFSEAEDILHIWYGLDYLTFFTNGPVCEKVKSLVRESRKKCGI